jgi:hypothetical protein
LGGGFAALSRFSVLFAVAFPKILQSSAVICFNQHRSPKLLDHQRQGESTRDCSYQQGREALAP